MYNVGVVPGKFFPPHRGHLYQIIRAATKCRRLYVVVSDNESLAQVKCLKDGLPYIPLNLRARWLSIELQEIENIKVITLDETGIPEYPHGTKQWSALLVKVMPEKFDIIFGGEVEYKDTYMQNFPGVEYEYFDYARTRYSMSATKIRNNYLENWDYILGCARPFFARRVLITGTESCAKTTLTAMLAKVFYTSWSLEYGRYYSKECLGGNESVFDQSDFEKIAWKQAQQDEEALRTANRIVFFDSDAVVTQYYCNLYTGWSNPRIEHFVNPQKYDAVLLMSPTVPWVDDGLRFKSSQEERYRLHDQLLFMYKDRGFKDKIIKIESPDYLTRFEQAVQVTDKLLADPKFMSRY